MENRCNTSWNCRQKPHDTTATPREQTKRWEKFAVAGPGPTRVLTSLPKQCWWTRRPLHRSDTSGNFAAESGAFPTADGSWTLTTTAAATTTTHETMYPLLDCVHGRGKDFPGMKYPEAHGPRRSLSCWSSGGQRSGRSSCAPAGVSSHLHHGRWTYKLRVSDRSMNKKEYHQVRLRRRKSTFPSWQLVLKCAHVRSCCNDSATGREVGAESRSQRLHITFRDCRTMGLAPITHFESSQSGFRRWVFGDGGRRRIHLPPPKVSEGGQHAPGCSLPPSTPVDSSLPPPFSLLF